MTTITITDPRAAAALTDAEIDALMPEPCGRGFDMRKKCNLRVFSREQVREAVRAALAAPTQSAGAEPQKLWLWKNGDHFLAFEHLYPCFTPGGDPMTLGDPVGYAIFKDSSDRTHPKPAAEPDEAQLAQMRERGEKARAALSTQPAPARVALTDEQIKAIYQKYGTSRLDGFTAAVRAVEALGTTASNKEGGEG